MRRDAKREDDIMRRWFAGHETLEQIGRTYGISRQRVQRLIRQALDRPRGEPGDLNRAQLRVVLGDGR